MPTCQGKLRYFGRPCPKTVKRGHKFCRWHDPNDESWRKDYERLREATATEKVDIILGLIEDHPEHRLVLPERDRLRADLYGIDLSSETLLQRKNQSGASDPPWLARESAMLSGANLQGPLYRMQGFNMLTCGVLISRVLG